MSDLLLFVVIVVVRDAAEKMKKESHTRHERDVQASSRAWEQETALNVRNTFRLRGKKYFVPSCVCAALLHEWIVRESHMRPCRQIFQTIRLV